MRAGLLREVVVFKEPTTIRTPTGASKTEYVPVYRCRMYKRRLTVATDKDAVDAKETFYGHTGIFQVRYSPKINDRQIVEFRGNEYRIDLLDRRPDNSYYVYVTKRNE